MQLGRYPTLSPPVIHSSGINNGQAGPSEHTPVTPVGTSNGSPPPFPPPFPLLPLQHNFVDLLDLADSGEAVAWSKGFSYFSAKQYVDDYRLALTIGHYYTAPNVPIRANRSPNCC